MTKRHASHRWSDVVPKRKVTTRVSLLTKQKHTIKHVFREERFMALGNLSKFLLCLSEKAEQKLR
jgi:hypothetical protein